MFLFFRTGFWTALVTLVLSPSLSARDQIILDRVEVNGFNAFSSQEIESLIEVSPGEAVERTKIIRTVENIQSFYHSHGYQEATVETSLGRKEFGGGEPEMTLEFRIHEYSPARIATIAFVPERMKDGSFQKFWKKIEINLKNKTGINVGEILDQEKITNAKKQIQEMLASEEFIGAKISDVRILNAIAPAKTMALMDKNENPKWAMVEFHVDLGDRVSFGFRGNTVFSQGHLDVLIEERRQLGFGKDYISEIGTRIREEYQANGYALADVKPYIFEIPERQERHVTYVIMEGPRVVIDSVDFDGNLVFSSKELQQQFFSKASEQVQRKYYNEKDVASAADLMIEWLKSKGYLSAKIVTINASFPPKPRTKVQNSSVKLIIYLYEGDQTIIQSINIAGARAISPSAIKKLLGNEEGAPLNLFAFTSGMEAIKAAYRAQGYLGAKITNENGSVISYSEENKAADIQVNIEEGPQYRVGKIQIEGLNLTKENVVRREIVFKEGEVLAEPDILAADARLRRLGIFSGVNIRVSDDPTRENYKAVRVILQEGTPGIVAGGVGLRNDLGIRLFGEVAYANVGGRDHTLSFNAAVNRRFQDYEFIEYQGQLAYLWPWFLKDGISFRPTLTVNATQYANLAAKQLTLATTWEKRLIEKPNLVGQFTYSLERINQFNSPSAIDNQEIRIGSITPALQLDLRNNSLSPTSGAFFATSYEIALPQLFSQSDPFPVGYTKFQFRTDAFIPITRDITWFIGLRTGFERQLEPAIDGNLQSGSIPAVKLFTLGGAASLRGFNEQAINVSNYEIQGTLSYANYRTQIDFPFSGALRFGPFFDAGNLFIDRLPFGSLREGAGAGFHYQTPVGPMNLDWGFNLEPQPGEDPNKIYFSIGII